ncbi:HAD-IA family hydrolase [Histidinibacterium aquaticum]|uniref:phosphoglycolate phosphatase n=1 Tax=Histidinibacterium aquaticum TaxID=2613962 RepID=A0A5J5GN00_9RHOB|nr:HAD-IA family hydrolase [Histidinibacterium aquaticum]KAA9009746.1 HAD-IA family hydrolase [Histidinibacterium aquaticum]
MRSVIFDLDGTLADTSRDLIAAANSCFRDLGLGDVLDPHADAETAFRGGRAMLTLGFERTGSHGEEEIDRQYPRLLDAYGEAICVETQLYPGAMDAVERLKGQGYAVGICTNKPEGLAIDLLDALGIRDAFGALVGADTLPVRKPDPRPFSDCVRRLGGDPGRSCLVGDTETDRKTAAAAGVPSILVAFGPSGDRVNALLPEATIAHFDELPGTVEALAL